MCVKTALMHGRGYYKEVDCDPFLSGWTLSTFDPSLNVALPPLALLDMWGCSHPAGCSVSLATKSLPPVPPLRGQFDVPS